MATAEELIRELRAEREALTNERLAADIGWPDRLRDRLADAVPPDADTEEQAAACARLAAAFDTADVTLTANVLNELDIRWRGRAATESINVLTATRDLARNGSGAIAEARRHLMTYLTALESLRPEMEAERGEMSEVAASLRSNPDRVRGHRLRLRRAIDRSIEALEGVADAESSLRAGLADVTAKARMGEVRPDTMATVPASVAVRIAAVGMNPPGASGIDDGILSTGQLRRLGDILDRMLPDHRERVLDLVAAAPSDIHAANIMKAVAAGHAVAEVEDFAGRIHGETEQWLREHLSLIRPQSADFESNSTRQVRFGGWLFGRDVEQFDERTCGPAVAVMALAMNDPIYALELTRADSATAFERRLNDEVERVFNELRGEPPDPRNTEAVRAFHDRDTGGVTTQALARELSEHQGIFGTSFRTMSVPTESQQLALDRVGAAVDQGHPAVLVVGDGVTGHVVLAVAHDKGTIVCWDPQEGRIVRFDGFSDDAVRAAGRRHNPDAEYGVMRQVIVPAG